MPGWNLRQGRAREEAGRHTNGGPLGFKNDNTEQWLAAQFHLV